MKTLLAALVFAMLAAACVHAPPGQFDFAEGQQQHAVRSAETEWRPCPPNLPSNCEIAVLEGNPQSPGLFTVRFKVGAGFKMPPHTHPQDERVTIISGQMAVAFGNEAVRDDAQQFGPGDYYVNAREVVHTVWADTAAELQITGFGPWEAHFIE